jgi:predicted nucleic acid-binding protein
VTVFVDTGVFYAHHDEDAERHDTAVAAFDALLDGAYGQPYTSDYVLDETVTLTRVRTGSFDAADTVARRILGDDPFPEVFTVLDVGSDHRAEALAAFRRFEDHDLSFTDAATVALCEAYGIDSVLSFDDDFDGLVDRAVPGDVDG